MLRQLTIRLLGQQSRLFTTHIRSPSSSVGLLNKYEYLFNRNPASLKINQYYSSRLFSSELIATWPKEVKDFLEKENITQPTMIQEKTLAIAMENKDLVGVARTGSGKTLAFVIPAIIKIIKAREAEMQRGQEAPVTSSNDEADDFRTRTLRHMKPPKCLVLAPTRELAGQTHDVFAKFRHMNVRSIPLVGGSSRSEQVRALSQREYDVYVATPGRLMDLIEADLVDLSQIQYLVLDEADRMLDMGFEPQIRRILSKIPKDRQTLMWSATWPVEIQSLAAEFLKQYEYIAVDSEKLKANPNIKQIIKICSPSEKLDLLLESLNEFKQVSEMPRVLVFVNTKRLADMLLVQMMRNRIRAITMHGNRTQKQRDDALRLFKDRHCNVLIATDVAARGLDISDITHVVNYDFPNTIEDYIHRIGRTARHERNGTAVTLFTSNEANIARKLIQVLKETKQEIPEQLEEFASNPNRYKDQFETSHNRSGRPNFYNSGGHFDSASRRLSNQTDIGFSDSRYNNQPQWPRNRYQTKQDDQGFQRRRFDAEGDDFFEDDGRKQGSRSRTQAQFNVNNVFAD